MSSYREGMKNWLLCLACWMAQLSFAAVNGEPTESREWTASSGHSITAIALKVKGGKVVLKKANGRTVSVPVSKLVDADREFLAGHFKLNDEASVGGDGDDAGGDTREAADDLPHPLGKTTGEISCGGGFSYYLYLPKSLRKGKRHPVLYIMSPGGGSARTVGRYIKGAERNGWILAVSRQSKNGFNKSALACDGMMDHVERTLPIDKKRIYTTGFSGGSRMAYVMSQRRKKISGIIACGAGGEIGSRKQIVYGLCGSNCFNRSDMAHSFKRVSHKGAVLRYFTGRHVWANGEFCEDAITHLNGVFLSANQSDYEDDYAEYLRQLASLVKDSAEKNPLRAYMWADFASQYDFKNTVINKIHQDLGGDDVNKLYVAGLFKIRGFAEKTFGKISSSQWKSDPRVSSACKREAKKYVGTPWEEVLNKMSEDAQKF